MSDADTTTQDDLPDGVTGEVDTAADGDRPDPADLEPISTAEAQHERDADGRLKTNYHAVKYNGDWRRIGLKPLVPAEADDLQRKFQGMGDNVAIEELYPVLEGFVREPEGVDWSDAKFPVIMSAVNALTREIQGQGGNEAFEKALENELAKRDDGDEGN